MCVIIPTYNNEKTLAKVVTGVLSYTSQVIVVNDGSTDSTATILNQFPGITVVDYAVNVGKGYALRQGFLKALALGYDYAITIDSDGQHYPDDLPLFLEKLKLHPGALIMGARNMEQAGVPSKSSFGNKFSTFWYKVETGITLRDTQTGYRLYPIRKMEHLSFITKKFEFEIEVIVRAAWSGIEITEIPVQVFYAEKDKRVSHFRPFKDFTRISILNTVLVLIAFLYIKPRDLILSFKRKGFREIIREQLFNPDESDQIKALSIGFGVFMGIVPIWGFQMAVGITLAFLLRLNKALVILAANISIPPMIPLILFISHLTGAIWMGDKAHYISFSDELTFDLMARNLQQYLLGATTLATTAGITFGLLTYLILKVIKKQTA